MSLCRASHDNFPRISSHVSKCSNSEALKPNVFNVVLSMISSMMIFTIPVFVLGREFFSMKTAQTISSTMGMCKRPVIPASLACFSIATVEVLRTAFDNVFLTESFSDDLTIHCASQRPLQIISSAGGQNYKTGSNS